MSHTVPGTEQAAVVPTLAYRRVQAQLPPVLANNQIALVTGPSGSGKTFAVEALVRSQQRLHRKVVWLQMQANPAPTEIYMRMVHELTGAWPNDSLFRVMDELVELLVDLNPVVIVDDAHELGIAALRRLKSLHTRKPYRWALVLVGIDVHTKVGLTSEVGTHIGTHVPFPTMDPDTDLLPTLAAYHPLFANTAGKDLRYIDEAYARGQFRLWAQVLRAALPIAEKHRRDRLDGQLIAATLASVGADGWVRRGTP
jgi:Cdc6-like AAA superfamily ATPase